MTCANCGLPAGEEYRLKEKRYCRLCASNITHFYQLTPEMVQAEYLPCPVFGPDDELIPFGVYPNIDYS